jgi:hypothetical protein
MILRLYFPMALIVCATALSLNVYSQAVSSTDSLLSLQQDTTALSGEIDEVTVTAFRTPYNLFNTPAPINLILPRQLETGSSLIPGGSPEPDTRSPNASWNIINQQAYHSWHRHPQSLFYEQDKSLFWRNTTYQR